jgi:hypothetical protein
MRFLVATALVAVPELLLGQQSPAVTVTNVVGTYRNVSAAHSGCAIEVGEPKGDTIRIQFDCNRGAPGYHHGANDVRVPLRDGVATSESHGSSGTCRLRFAFRGDRVRVTQNGSDIACGFGAFVEIDGTYPRVSRRAPKFDLLPL